MTTDYFQLGVSATNAVVANQRACEALEADDDEMFAREAWASYDRDSRED